MLFDSNNTWVVLGRYWRKVVVDRKHDRPCLSLKMLLWAGWTLDQGKCQHDRFTILDGVKVLYGRFGEAFCSDTTEAAPSTAVQRRYNTTTRKKQDTTYTSPYGERVNDRFLVI